MQESILKDIHKVYAESIVMEKGEIFDCEVLCDTPEEKIGVVTTNDKKVTCKRCLKIMEGKDG